MTAFIPVTIWLTIWTNRHGETTEAHGTEEQAKKHVARLCRTYDATLADIENDEEVVETYFSARDDDDNSIEIESHEICLPVAATVPAHAEVVESALLTELQGAAKDALQDVQTLMAEASFFDDGGEAREEIEKRRDRLVAALDAF